MDVAWFSSLPRAIMRGELEGPRLVGGLRAGSRPATSSAQAVGGRPLVRDGDLGGVALEDPPDLLRGEAAAETLADRRDRERAVSTP